MSRDPRTFSFEATARTSADATTLFGLAADGSRWSEWAGLLAPRSSWERQGDPAPDGIGAVRRIGLWPIVVREETIAYERDRLHAYTLVSRVPLRDYRAEVRFEPHEDGGTTVVWHGRFTELAPGTGRPVAAALGAVIRSLTRRLVREAERRTA